MSLNSRRKLKPADADRFTDVGPDLFSELAKVVCRAGMLPEKELHECWEMASVVHKAFPESLHIADIAAGHGLLAWILVLLARCGPLPIPRTAVAIDIQRPKSADALAASIIDRWPNLADTVHYVEGSIQAVRAEDGSGTLFVAAHACGSLSDQVLLAAMTSRSPVAIMPCCHSLRKQTQSLSSLALASDLPPHAVDSIFASAATIKPHALIDQFRIDALVALGYQIIEDRIQPEITAFNRIIMGRPPEAQDKVRCATRQIADVPHKVKRVGEIRAYENVHSLNIADIKEIQSLSRRPSREWIRFFDLSYWVDDDSIGHRFAAAIDFLSHRIFLRLSSYREENAENAKENAAAAFEYLSEGNVKERPISGDWSTNISILDRYTEAVTQRLAYTYRVEIRSSSVSIEKADTALLRRQLCRALHVLSAMLQANVVLREK